ncbi:hypothetical protein JCM8097_009340 [Rhodosporidiobolus ruineniae]
MLVGGNSALALVLALLPLSASATTIELTRQRHAKRVDGSCDLDLLNAEISHLAVKYERNRKNWRYNAFGEDPEAKSSRKKKRGTIALTTQDVSVWTGKVTIGTPAQSFNIYFDSGSSDFTVASTNCPTTSCGTKDRYNVAASSTQQTTTTTVSTSFVDGTTSKGTLIRDTVSCAGVTVTSQSVIAASSLSSTVSSLESDGMGLAYPALSQAFSNSFPFTAYAQGQGSLPSVFGLNLKSQGTSQLTFGGYNRARIAGNPRWYNVKLEDTASFRTYWQIGASAPFVNGAQAIATRVNHILDSGTTLIVAPPSAAAEFWAKVPGAKVYNSYYWTFPCDSPPQVSFSFARITLQMYDVSDYDFSLGYLSEDSSRCVGSVIGQNLGLGTSWLLGDAFMTNWYVIHDVAKNLIGLGVPR